MTAKKKRAKKKTVERVEFRLLAAQSEVPKIKKALSRIDGVKVIVGDKVDPDVALRHEAAAAEAAGILRSAGYSGVVMLNLDLIE